MITILVLGAPHAGPETGGGHPSVEILTAGTAEEALEKLARNRRIDAVLLLSGSEAAELASTLAEEDPSAPPLFAPASAGMVPGVLPLPDGDLARLLDEMVRRLETDA
jgi:hypothetical protein